MRIDWVVPCRYAEIQQDGTLNLTGAGIDTFWLADDALPSDVGMFLAIRLLGQPDELLHPHELALGLTRPNVPNPEALVTAQIQGQPPIEPTPGGEAQIAFPMVIRFSASVFGLYVLQITLNGEQRAVPFGVRPLSERPHA
jgi:hypothetical protein